jgi:ABC-type Mn2+/Zn2+ transport system ATPase subunit
MLDRFGLLDLADRYAGDLSGGQRRLVEIMRALVAQPDVLLLDEPMAGVHPRLAHQIGMRLVSLCEAGMTVVMGELAMEGAPPNWPAFPNSSSRSSAAHAGRAAWLDRAAPRRPGPCRCT